MSSMNSLYVGLIEETGGDQPFVQTYWARGAQIGEAVDKMLEAARSNGLVNPVLMELDPYDIDNLPEELEEVGRGDVFWAEGRSYFEGDTGFAFPYGVIPSCLTDDNTENLDDITEEYSKEVDDDGLHTLVMNVSADRLFPVYERLLNKWDEFEVFWYCLHDHWQDEEQGMYVNDSLDTPEKITQHLREHWFDSVMNGFVTLTSFVKEGATNININDHKQIVVLTYSEEVSAMMEEFFEAEGVGRNDNMVSVVWGIHHWHYRPSQSLSRNSLSEYLLETGFRKWDPEG